MLKRSLIGHVAAIATIALSIAPAFAQPPAGGGSGRGGRGPQAPPVVSPEVSADRHVTFRINDPQAQSVRVTGGDIPGIGQSGTMTKAANGVWEVTVGPLDAGGYDFIGEFHSETARGRIVAK